jgi:hypothetical protein
MPTINSELLRRAVENPQDLRFDEATALADQLGFGCIGGEGSHRVYRHPAMRTATSAVRDQHPRPLNLQRGDNGKAKAYQVRQMIKMARSLGLLPTREEE